MITKSDLLNLNIFYDNKYLDKYVNLINANENTHRVKFETEHHHIIPRIYFKYKKEAVNNSNANMVHLNYCDHVLAHCLLALSFNDNYFISASIDAVYAVLNQNKIYKSLEDFVKDFDEVKDVLKCNHTVSEEQKIKLSKISSNSHWYNNGINETFSQVQPDGWSVGRLPVKNSTKLKASARCSACHWYTNGVECTFSTECPEGWVPGRVVTEKLRRANAVRYKKPVEEKKVYVCKTKFRWYNNGIVENRFIIDTQPENFVPGRLKSTGEKISKTKLILSKQV